MSSRITTQQLYDVITRGLDKLSDRLQEVETQSADLRRSVHGTNGEGLWDILRSMREEARRATEEHREEHRRLWERITEVEGRVYQHSGIQQGEQSGAQGRRARREGGRRSIEVWLFGSVLAVVALLQGLQVIGVV